MVDYLKKLNRKKVLTLGDTLPASFCSSNFDGAERDYLPERCLYSLIAQDAVVEELAKFQEDMLEWDASDRADFSRKYNDSSLHKLAEWILANARRAFAVAIQCNLRPLHLLLSMVIFKDSEFTDEDLPLADPRITQAPSEKWAEDIWTPRLLRDFYGKQWTCLVPVFSPDNYQLDLPQNYIFPFTKEDENPKVGAFSSVYKVSIHPEHQRHKGMEHVAIKTIQVTRGNDKIGTDKAWDQEARALANINDMPHEHIIECVAAIRRGDSRYFMFPWANGDSLREHWNRKDKQHPNATNISQALIQLRGLSDALDHLHNYDGTRRNSNGADTDVDDEHPSNPDVQVQDEYDQISKPMEAPIHGNIRHGDLKPENILRFVGSEGGLGTLKIADMGLAKRHIVATQDRSLLTSTSYGTIHYEPPEAAPGLKGPRSRLYDVWSMGCITLEFIIWILYGNDDLNSFYSQVKGDKNQVCHYYEFIDDEERQRPVVHPVVLRWIDHIRKWDPECSQDSAIKDLLNIVQEKLLVVALPPTRATAMTGGRPFAQPEDPEKPTQYRATAAEFRDALDHIIDKTKDRNYLCGENSRHDVKPLPIPTKSSSSLTPDAARNRDKRTAQRHRHLLGQPDLGVLSNYSGRPVRLTDYTLPPMKDWEFEVDNTFAQTLLAQVGAVAMAPSPTKRAALCRRCVGLNFWAGGFAMGDTIESLLSRAKICNFCDLLARVCQKNRNIVGGNVQIERNQSNLVIPSDPVPILSICRSPESTPPTPIQLGLPKLPEPGSELFYTILKLWLKSCMNDENHRECQVKTQVKLPTRLIDVGSEAKPSLRLVETGAELILNRNYVALSHPWGDTKAYTPFSTLRNDRSGAGHDISHFKRAIPEHELPATFKDAIVCTRKLAVRYLWIDSLCIIQGRDGDFNEEAKRMEDVFSGAYCVLAASRANSQLDGFLGPRPQRKYITFQRVFEKPFYLCEAIDNFSQDVIEGPLNRRGWVLQERALARRTIYFTEHQTYFECGKGVRCETLTNMHNNMADFLGDPNFPAKAMRTTSRALKISYFQGLYKQYSRLNFTRPDDRPFAIAGLEKRLLNAYETAGGFGIFDDGSKADGGLFHRSLLWRRGEEEGDTPELVPIDFPVERNIHVPSWSWMAYTGGIEYTDPPFRSAEWETTEIKPPWTRGNTRNASSAPRGGEVAISAIVREYRKADWKENEAKLVFDRNQVTGSEGRTAHCVVVARSLEGRVEQRRHYVLLVAPAQETTGRGEQTYRRIGAGFMLGKFIALDVAGTAARVV